VIESLIQPFLYWSFVISFGYLAVLYGFIALLSAIAVFENRTRRTEQQTDDRDALLDSRFTIPASVIVPAYNEEGMITKVVRCLLELEYAEYEVILVNDGSTDGTLAVLQREFALEQVDMFYRRVIPTKQVRAVYRSKSDPKLIVVDKENGGKADGLNCGVNFSKYRYVCCLDGDTIYRRDALLAGMRLAVKDPATVLGVTSLIAVGRRVDEADCGEIGRKTVERHLWINLQHIEILRAFVNNRLAWSRLGFMLCVSGAFAIWRRDVVVEVGGFAPHFTCEDIEMTFRVFEKYLREGKPVKVLALPNIVGVTEGPERLAGLISQRARWQRVILETVWHYRRMFLNPRYGPVGFLGMPFFILSECLGPFMQVLVIATLTLAVVLGVLDWTEFLALAGIQVFALGILSSLGLWMNDWSFRYYRLRALARLILIAPLDLFYYRPVLMYANAKGVVEFFRGDKSWERFARNTRD
jgi:cellulose synthase/poly-beta-1,6-N-acetylglucosamine synthase-like glycosyltransferase